jgi:putative tryptophan/tyrosine transport system substrate-binding protein
MKRLAICVTVTLALGLLSAPLSSEAQPAAKVPRVGYLSAGAAATSTVEVFRQRLRELGYKDGQSVVIEERWAEGQVERLPALATELVRLQVQVIFAGGPAPLRAAMQATATIPIVAIDLETDPVAMGFVASLARPGGNVTGVFLDLPELSGKQLELLREAMPGVARVAVLWDPTSAPFPLRALEVAAQALGVTLHILEVRSPDEFVGAFATMTRGHAEALIVLSSPLYYYQHARLVDLAVQHRLPVMATFREFAQAGALITYGPNLEEMARHAATYVGRILKGATPAELLIERPARFELVVNLKTAEALGLTVPPVILLQAHEVIR